MSITFIEKDASAVQTIGSNVSGFRKFRQLANQFVLSPWKWFAITCVLLTISGGLRSWRDSQFRSLLHESAACPFPLSELPKVLGEWQAVTGSESQLDPEIARIAGSSDHFIRVYESSRTGDQVSVLVLYGLARAFFGHSPEICYPSAGYLPAGERGPIDRAISLPGLAVPAQYRSAYYVKRASGLSQYNEVLCSFRHNGAWLPDVADRWKMFRYHPGMFKVQLHHPCAGIASEAGPSESLLKDLIQEIEKRIVEKEAAERHNSAPAQAPAK
jgi:hypothetical protein